MLGIEPNSELAESIKRELQQLSWVQAIDNATDQAEKRDEASDKVDDTDMISHLILTLILTLTLTLILTLTYFDKVDDTNTNPSIFVSYAPEDKACS